jgi:hypothetical protein
MSAEVVATPRRHCAFFSLISLSGILYSKTWNNSMIIVKFCGGNSTGSHYYFVDFQIKTNHFLKLFEPIQAVN